MSVGENHGSRSVRAHLLGRDAATISSEQQSVHVPSAVSVAPRGAFSTLNVHGLRFARAAFINALSLEQLDALMTAAGNEAPLMWLLIRRNYDPRSLRVFETETERQNRELREENAALRRVLMGAQ